MSGKSQGILRWLISGNPERILARLTLYILEDITNPQLTTLLRTNGP